MQAAAMSSLLWEDNTCETTSHSDTHSTTNNITSNDMSSSATSHGPCGRCLAMLQRVEAHYRDVTLRLLREMHALEARQGKANTKAMSREHKSKSYIDEEREEKNSWSGRQVIAELRATRRSIEQECASVPPCAHEVTRSERHRSSSTCVSPSPDVKDVEKRLQPPILRKISASRVSPTGTDPTRVSPEPLFCEAIAETRNDEDAYWDVKKKEEVTREAVTQTAKQQSVMEDSRVARLEQQLLAVNAEMAELRSATTRALQQVCSTVHELALSRNATQGVLS